MPDTDKPLSKLAEIERKTPPANEFESRSDNTSEIQDVEAADPRADDKVEDRPEDLPAGRRLRAFEDEHLGPDVSRINGSIERGHGSRFQRMHDDEKAEHAALERLMEAEKELQTATAELSIAQEKHAKAAEHLDRASEHHAKAAEHRAREKREREEAEAEARANAERK